MSVYDNILIVMGMHRSGTSFLTHCMEILGFGMPGDRADPAWDNPHGHFEPQAIVNLNEGLLSRDGAIWTRIGKLNIPPMPAEMASALKLSFGTAPRIAIKDPRMSLLMSAWRPCLEGLGPCAVLIALRHPGEVAASLARRDAIGADLSHLSWIAHNLSALETTLGMRRGLILFPDWTEDIGAALARICALTGIMPPRNAARDIAARFDDTSIHATKRLTANNPDIGLLATDLFDLLAHHARNGSMPEAGEIAPYRERFDLLAPAARDLEAYSANQVRWLELNLRTLTRDAKSLQTQIAEAREERNLVVATLEKQRNETAAQRDEMTAQCHDIADQHDEIAQELSLTKQQLSALHAQHEHSDRIRDQQLRHLTQLLERERMTVLKPIYRRIHRSSGQMLRKILPNSAFEQLKRAMPYPGGIPTYLAYAPGQPATGEFQTFADIDPASPEKPDIFIMSIINWDFRTQRPQHLANELAEAGHRVFFIEMETDPGIGSARKVRPNLHVVRLPARGMRGATPYAGKIPESAKRAWVDHFYRFADQIGASAHAHIVIEHPYWWNFTRHLSAQFQLTFDCMDEVAGFSNTEPAILDLEEEMIEKADQMIVSSQYLHDKYAARRSVALIRNGTDVSHFTDRGGPLPTPGFLAGKLREGAIRVGYVGAIAEWFDTDLLETIARDNPDFDIHLCGAVTAPAPARLQDLPNVTLHGEIAYADVPAFLDAMDVLTIPFQLLPIINACDPVKFYEYSARRKPTVATTMPELARAGDLVTTADDPQGFAAGIRTAAEKAADPAYGARLRSYALENSWSYRAADMLTEMERAAQLSVVILAYGPADLTLACLKSLLEGGGTYPNIEILVVDNGSAPAELEQLREATADHRIRLIENGTNLGFARGNNVGIEAARGEYVLLLNNDTYVAPGALTAMIRHLEHHPGIGIIGPMTNNIGNEARVDVSYADMGDMKRVARDLVTGHRGTWTPIPVTAYFCAMFRKADLDRIGHLPTVYGRGMFEDDDHCASFREAGLKTALAEDAFVHHQLSATFNKIPSGEKAALFAANKVIFETRWGKWNPHRYRDDRPEPSLPPRRRTHF
ncbi:MAG: glycosyltransferase [Paracoccus sp. (in: a-proteobacteria)]